MFTYHVVLAKDYPQPASLIASWIETDQPLQAILRSAADLAFRLNDHEYKDSVEPAMNTDLPHRGTLLQMCQEGKATRLIWGPRRS